MPAQGEVTLASHCVKLAPMRRLFSAYPWLPMLLPSVAAMLLTTSPTWGALDYHASLALAPLVGLCAMVLDGQRPTRRWPWLVLVLGPLAVLLVASVVVPNCSRLYGLGFYVLGPVLSAWVGLGWSRLGALLSPKHPRRATWLALIASLALPAWHFLTQPQVFAFHGLTGFIAGALYEDAVTISLPYLTWRALDLVLWWPVIAVPRVRWTRGLVTAQAALGLTLCVQAGTLGWRISADAIRAELTTTIRVPGQYIAHLPHARSVVAQQHLWASDIAFRYRTLSTAFGVAPGQPIELFFYASAAQKQRWMGAHRVDMAKPWLAQVHMVLPDVGSTTLTHELAHVFAASWSTSPLGIPLRHGVVPDAIAIEGLAVAMEWPIRHQLDPHQWTRAMRQAGLAPDITQLWSLTGFLGQQSDRAYTVAGSFLRWLGQTRGWPAVRRVYAGESLESVTGQSLAALAAAWGAYVDDPAQHPLTTEDLSRAKLRFARAGLFEAPCALATGRSCERASHLAAVGRAVAAVHERDQLLASIAAWLPPGGDDPELHLALADDLAQAGDLQRAATELADLRARTGRSQLHPLVRAAVDVADADVRWRQGQVGQAEAIWTRVAQMPLAEGFLRTLEVKRHFARSAAAADAMRGLWLAGGDARPAEVERLLEDLARALPDDPVAQSLWARRQLSWGEARVALEVLDRTAIAALGSAPYTARECSRQAVWHAVVAPEDGAVSLWTRMIAEAAAPASLVAEWQARGQ